MTSQYLVSLIEARTSTYFCVEVIPYWIAMFAVLAIAIYNDRKNK